MSNVVFAQAAKLLDASLGTSALTAFSGAPKVRLTTTAPTASAAGTELTGSGYTAGGTATAFTAASAAAGTTTGPTAQLSWTNGSGASWSIVGWEVWDQAGTPLRWWWGTFTGQPLVVPAAAIFQIPAGNMSFAL